MSAFGVCCLLLLSGCSSGCKNWSCGKARILKEGKATGMHGFSQFSYFPSLSVPVSTPGIPDSESHLRRHTSCNLIEVTYFICSKGNTLLYKVRKKENSYAITPQR